MIYKPKNKNRSKISIKAELCRLHIAYYILHIIYNIDWLL